MNNRFYCDSHTHSEHSFDGNDSVIMMCEQAIKLGLYSITITDHCECNEYFEKNVRKDIEASILSSNKARACYGDKINVFTGVELGQATQSDSAAADALSLCNYDFVLGSLHNLKGKEDFYFLSYTEENYKEILDRYFDELLDLVKDNRFDSLAHLTYPLRYIYKEFGRNIKLEPFSEKIDEILLLLAKNGKALEINSSGLRQHIGKTLPDEEIVARFRQLGGKYVTIGSDAHRWGDIGSGIENCYAIAKKGGFSYITVFEKREPKLLPIE